MKRRFETVEELRNWLKKVAGITILSATLLGSTGELITAISSPLQLQHALTECSLLPFSDLHRIGPCLLEYESSTEEEQGELNVSQYMAVFVAEAQLTTGRKLGSLERLLASIDQSDILVVMQPPEPGYRLGHVLIPMPQDPSEVVRLRDVLVENSVLVVVPDGSGYIHEGNSYHGNGLRFA